MAACAACAFCKQGAAHPGSTQNLFTVYGQNAGFVVLSWAPQIDTEEKKLLNKVIRFVFFAHNKYLLFNRSFIKLMLNHWFHMDYFNDVLLPFYASQIQ